MSFAKPTYTDLLELDYIRDREISVIHLAILGRWPEAIELRKIHNGGKK